MVKKKMSDKFLLSSLLGIVVLVALVGLVTTMQGETTGKAVYTSVRICPDGYVSYAADSPVLAAKLKADHTCVKSAYPGWYCCDTFMN
ncbi:hypothetical protein KY333_03550 [Candidatus Woesearchaeota archaeon]|nr:hypothetical protein [Candidatus Woesearchaeota archaeon]MBW2994698.1 hypothetical protein [Candidatus Woesearchaeota archaeon]